MRNEKLFFCALLVFFFCLEISRGQNNGQTQVNVGVVTDVGTSYSEVAMLCINMSLDDFYSSRPQFQTRLVFNVGDSKSDVVGAATARSYTIFTCDILNPNFLGFNIFTALELIKNKQVKAILGPWTSMQAHFLIEIGQKTRVPIVSYSATSPSLTSLRSPYFFRATYEDSSQVNAIKAIINLFGWREVVPVYIDNTFGEGIMPRLTDALQDINVRIPYRSVIALNATDHEISVELLKMMTMPTRVFIVHMLSSLASRVFIKAKEIGLMKPGYVWILTNGVTDDLSSISETGVEAMEGVLGIKTYIPKSKDLDKFRSRWKRRFPQMKLNVYGLWAYDATTALAIAIEEAGINNMTFSNVVDTGKNVSELETLGLSQFGPKLLQTLSIVHFKGLAGDFRFFSGQLQPSVFEIVNMIGTGEKSIGFWTEKNGLVKKLDHQPSSIDALSTWKYHLKQITWPGEADFVPKGWEIPTNGKKLRIGVPKRIGFTDLVKVTRDPITNSTVVTGFCIDFFEAVIRAMPYDVSYEFIPFEKPDGKPAGNHNDLVHQVYLRRYDAVVGDTTILANRSSYVDFTLPFIKSGVGLIVPLKDEVKRDKFSFLKPLSIELWLTSLGFFFLVGITVWIIEHRVNPDFRGRGRFQASTIFWFAFSTMVFAPRERVLSFWARALVVTWYFVVLVLTQSYTASLASLLTSQQLNPTITSMSSLLDKGETVGYQRTSFILGKLKETGFRQSSLVPFDTAEECNALLKKGPKKGGVSAAFLGTPYVRLFLGQYCNTYKMVEEPFNVDGFGFVFPIGSPLVADVSRAILRVAESPKAMELEHAWFKKKEQSCPDPVTNPDSNPSVTSIQLGVRSFEFLFGFVSVVCALALGKFILYFLWKRPRENSLWREFHQPDPDSYINVENNNNAIHPRDRDFELRSLSTWKYHLKPIKWPGEVEVIPKGWEIPTNSKKLRIGVSKRNGYTDLMKVTRDHITNSSHINPIANKPVITTWSLPSKYDAVVGDTTILANSSSYVDFTFPVIKSGVGLIALLEDQVKRDNISFLKPLTWKLWMTSFFFFFLIGFTVWVVEHRVNPDFRGPPEYQASTIFWFAFSTMVFAPRPHPVTTADPNPSISSRQLGVDSFWVLFLIAFLMCVFTLGKFTFFFVKANQDNSLWQEFHKPDEISYINNVEKCPCLLNEEAPVEDVVNPPADDIHQDPREQL
ncbi:unnamed protein product [Arabidopsis thaliana]|uniref:Ionotropic glutamate receptor C-terminal domain-containing protein n=2 Tax=Arabidopsis thaliana TaxID=3702 RepID=A0A5S9X174_ARATH|nr:unnamed protein product [Arabidopsis thaliana]